MTSAAAETPPARRAWALATAGSCALPALVLLATWSRPLWLDEAASATMAELPASSLRRVLLDREGNGLLHTLLLRVWQVPFPGDAGLRLLSVVCGVAAVVLLALLARRLVGDRAAVLVPPLLVCNPLFVRYVAEARSYALLLALSCAAGLLLVRAVESPSVGRWLAYAGVAGLATYAQYFAVLMVAGHLLAVLLLRGSRPRLPVLLPAALLYGLLLAPLPRLMTDAAASGVGYLEGSPLARARPLLLAGFALAAVAAVAASALVSRRRPAGRRTPLRVAQQWPVALLATWLVVPVVLAVLLSLVQAPALAPRYFMVCLPPAVLLLAAGLARLHRRVLLAAVGTACAAGVAVGFVWIDRHTEAWDAVAAHVAAQADADDRVLFVAPYVRLAYERHHDRSSPAQPAYPALPWGADLADLFFFTPLPPDQVRRAVATAEDVHLVVSHVGLYDDADPAYAQVAEALEAAGLEKSDETAFKGAVVERWSAAAR